MSAIQSVAVFCGSRNGNKPTYMSTAEGLGDVLVTEKIDLIYGGGVNGLMGAVAKTVDEGGQKVTGVVPISLGWDMSTTYGETINVETLQERKAAMFSRADAFIALPGGYGTMDELMDVIDTYQLEVHNKPIGILNVNNYYDKILEWIKFSINEGFIHCCVEDVLVIDSDPIVLIKKMKEKKSKKL